MKRLFLSVTAGLTMFAFLPEAKAQGRRGMMMARPQMMMNSNMMGRMMTPNMMTGNMMNGTMMGGRMMNGNMNGMMNGNMTGNMTGMMNGNMTGRMMTPNMMTGNMMTPFGFPNGFGGVGNQGLGFPGTGFAANEHRGIRGRDQTNLIQDGAQRLA